MTNKKYYLEADTINGVTPSDWAEMENADVLANGLFYDSLADCEDGETLYGVVNQEIYDKIKAKYGIN